MSTFFEAANAQNCFVFWLLPGPNAGGVLEEQSRLSAGEDSEIQLFFGKENSYLFLSKWPHGH